MFGGNNNCDNSGFWGPLLLAAPLHHGFQTANSGCGAKPKVCRSFLGISFESVVLSSENGRWVGNCGGSQQCSFQTLEVYQVCCGDVVFSTEWRVSVHFVPK